MTRHGSPQRPPSQACRGERTSLYRADLDPPNSDFLPKSDGAFRQRERRMKGGLDPGERSLPVANRDHHGQWHQHGPKLYA